MSEIRIRSSNRSDLGLLATLIDEFARGHPAERYPRTPEGLDAAFFGERALGGFLLAETDREVVGFAGWTKIYDIFWAMYGGQPIALYVRPGHRGKGVGAMLIASVCAAIRAEGGEFLWSSYDPRLARLYERVAIPEACRSSHLSAAAFRRVADLAGSPPREILRRLPDRRLNFQREG